MKKLKNCEGLCMSHSVFGFFTITKGICCSEFEEKHEQFYISLIGKELLAALKNFGKNTPLVYIFQSILQSDSEYYAIKNCYCGKSYSTNRILNTVPTVFTVSIQ
jgi:hypothetical protein